MKLLEITSTGELAATLTHKLLNKGQTVFLDYMSYRNGVSRWNYGEIHDLTQGKNLSGKPEYRVIYGDQRLTAVISDQKFDTFKLRKENDDWVLTDRPPKDITKEQQDAPQ